MHSSWKYRWLTRHCLVRSNWRFRCFTLFNQMVKSYRHFIRTWNDLTTSRVVESSYWLDKVIWLHWNWKFILILFSLFNNRRSQHPLETYVLIAQQTNIKNNYINFGFPTFYPMLTKYNYIFTLKVCDDEYYIIIDIFRSMWYFCIKRGTVIVIQE